MFKIIISWWNNFMMSDEERYLNQAVDQIDLENRLRNVFAYHNQSDTSIYKFSHLS